MILKVLLVIGVIAAVYFLFIKKKPISTKDQGKDSKSQSNDMIECNSCGIYVDVNEALLSNGKYYCSQECIDKEK